MVDFDLETVGWAKRSVPTNFPKMPFNGAHGAARLCTPYEAGLAPAAARSYFS
jgi:hypothetical protein